MQKREGNLIIIKIKKLKFYLLFIILISLVPSVISLKANSYNYDKNKDLVAAPSAYFLSQFINLEKLLPVELKERKIKAIELAYIKDSKEQVLEIILLCQIINLNTNHAKGLLIFLTSDYQYKTYLMSDNDLEIPNEPKSICYTNGLIYIASGEEINKFTRNFYNPLNNELIANNNEVLSKELENKINIIHSELDTIDKEKAAKFKQDYQNVIKPQALIYSYKRVVDNELLPLNKPLNFIRTFGLSSKDMLILKTPFRPIKIVANENSEVLYVISQDSEMGILAFRYDGTFVKFIGSNKIELTLKEKLWRKLVNEDVLDSEAQKKQLNFTSMALDNGGFLYTVTAASKNNPVQRFNQAGKNILIQDKNKLVIGDYSQLSFEKQDLIKAKFSNIAVSNYKTYILYDSNNNKLFSYNNNGELMFVYGTKGNSIEDLANVRDLKIINNDIALIENNNYNNYLKILKPTKYGELINEATINYANGNYEQSAQIYKDLLVLNANSEYAYNGLGKIALLNSEYKQACDYFMLANNQNLYLEAYEKYRNLQIAESIYLFLSIALLVFSYTLSKRFILGPNERKNKKIS